MSGSVRWTSTELDPDAGRGGVDGLVLWEVRPDDVGAGEGGFGAAFECFDVHVMTAYVGDSVVGVVSVAYVGVPTTMPVSLL